jgi:hypothetical protein
MRRREFLWAGTAALAGGAWLLARGSRAADPPELPEITRRALEKSPLVYISPLRPSGRESSCHGEVWFFEDRGDVVIITGNDAWKARALRQGWAEARLWVGDFGPVSSAGEKFRGAPEFRARASLDPDPAVFERLLASYARKYADSWQKWEPRFRKGHAEGSRVLIRYSPAGS